MSYLGPSVKFVSVIIDAFSNKKMGVKFFHRKKTKPSLLSLLSNVVMCTESVILTSRMTVYEINITI